MGMIQNKVKVSQPVSHVIIENAGGLRGPAGEPGQPGPQGEPGVPGADGQAATIAVGTTTTLPEGSSATVTNTGTSSEAVFNFGIPKGDKGDKGDAGAGLVITGSVATYADLPNNLTPADAGKAYFVEADGKLYVWSGTQFPAEGEGSQFEGPQGPAGQDGADGQAATITVGSTTTLSPGASATVTNSGTSSAAVFDFGIPQGATGAAGPANTLSIGTVQGGDTAAATITGTAPNQTLNLTLPKGDKGDQGDPGPEPELFRNVEGTNIELTDAGSGIKSLNYIYGDTEQETLSGKNLLPVPTTGSITSNDITTTYNNYGSMAISGTANTTWCNIKNWAGLANTIPAGTYTISAFRSSNIQVQITLYEGSIAHNYFINGGSTSTTITTTFTTTATVVGLASLTQGQTVDDTIRVQIEAGSTTTSYEPYCGGTASPNPNYPQIIQTVTGEQTITIADGEGNEHECIINLARNLFTSPMIQGATNASTGAIISTNTRITSQDWLELPAGTYTINATTSLTQTLNCSCVTFETDKTTQYVIQDITGVWLSLPITFTTPKTILFKANFKGAGDPTITPSDVSNIQLEQGSTPTAYIAPIELCKIGTYQDYIYKSGSDWYIHKETGKHIVVSNEPSMSWDSARHRLIFQPTGWGMVETTSDDQIMPAVSDKFIAGSVASVATAVKNGMCYSTGGYVSLLYLSWADQAAALAQAVGTNIYYALATPTETQITDATLISQLNALNSATLYNGDTYIQVTSTDIPGEIDIDYWTYFHRNIETVDIEDGAVTPAKLSPLTLQAGVKTITVAGWVSVDFDHQFSSVPTVVATLNTETAETSTATWCKISNITGSGFRVAVGTSSGYGTGRVDWIATGV